MFTLFSLTFRAFGLSNRALGSLQNHVRTGTFWSFVGSARTGMFRYALSFVCRSSGVKAKVHHGVSFCHLPFLELSLQLIINTNLCKALGSAHIKKKIPNVLLKFIFVDITKHYAQGIINLAMNISTLNVHSDR